MHDNFQILPVRTDEDLGTATELFETYAASLPVALGYQDFDSELAALPGKYAPPSGELLVARDAAGNPLGCVGLRSLSARGCCEMKRLFLLPGARGLGLGRALAQAVVELARQRGYHELRLDTLPTMSAAISLYKQMGFQRIEPYYEPTPYGTIFMSLTLD